MKLLLILPLLVVGYTGSAHAQMNRVTVCGTGTPPAGNSTPYQDQNGQGCVSALPGQRTIVALDAASVTTGGTAVTALAAGHRTAGGWIANPVSATVNLCINEQGTASGTTSAGPTTCITPGQVYTLAPAAGAVSVISSDSAHAFSGQGYTAP